MANKGMRVRELIERAERRMERQRTQARGVLFAEGDSWFDLPFPRDDLLDALEEEGYEKRSVAQFGDKIESMATPRQMQKLANELSRLKNEQRAPVAVLLSGGGNDIIGSPLEQMLHYNGTSTSPLRRKAVSRMVDGRLRKAYEILISRIDSLCRKLFKGKKIPILVHGYANPVPDGRGYEGYLLQESFHKKGYTSLEQNTKTMADLLHRFNMMLKLLEKKHRRVRYVDLRPFASNDVGSYMQDWADELHLKWPALRRMAKEIDNVI